LKVGDVFVRMALDNKDYRRGLDREEGFTRQKAMTLGTVFSKGFSVALGIGLVHGFKTVGGLLTDLITTAAKTETFDVAMQAVARSSGYPIPVLQQQRKEVMALGIAEQEATQMMTRFMQAQLDTADAAKIARIAQDAGTVASMNSSEATAQITEAIAKLRPELLTAFGFTRNLNDIYGDYARTVGKTATQLSEVEKKQAMLNYIFREGEKIAGAYDSAMGTVGKKMGSLEKLELSKKLMQELKTALAQPLLLPAFGYWVDTMHSAFERAKGWVEANQATLINWGQTAKNVVASIVRGVQWITNAFIRNWGAIKFAATAFISYLVLSRAINLARTATLAFSIAVSVLRGQSVITSGVLGVLSTVVQTYRLQMALAPVATNIFTASLYSLQAGLYAVWAALGPVGWIILAISAAIAGGSYLWSKYSTSVRAANDAAREAQMKKLADQQAAAANAAMKAVKGEDKLTDAIKKAGKAAAKTLMPFDEIHTIQKDMAGMDDIGGLDMPATDMPDLGFPGMGDFVAGFGDGLDELKPTFKGFLSWMWEEAKGLFSKYFEGWDWWEILLLGLGPATMLGVLIYKNWDKVADWAKEKFGPMWDAVKAKWGDFKTWCSETWQALWGSVQDKWERFKTWASDLWGRVKTKWEEFKTWCSETWQAFWGPIQDKWERFKTWAGNLWEGAKTKWEAFKADIKRRWEAFWTPIKNKWLTFTGWAEGIWSRIKTEWDKIKKWSLWSWIKNKIDWLKGVFDFKWSLPKIKMPKFSVTWDTSGLLGKVGEYLGLPGVPKLNVTWLAKGGILNRPTLIGAGEAGREAVLPLDQDTGWIDELAEKLQAAGGTTDNTPVSIYLSLDGTVFGKLIAKSLRDLQRQGGGQLIPV
jgi:hypothetical protein